MGLLVSSRVSVLPHHCSAPLPSSQLTRPTPPYSGSLWFGLNSNTVLLPIPPDQPHLSAGALWVGYMQTWGPLGPQTPLYCPEHSLPKTRGFLLLLVAPSDLPLTLITFLLQE